MNSIFRDKLSKGLLVVFFVSACSSHSSSGDLDSLIVERAYDVHREQPTHPAVTQLSYKVNIPYPSRAIADEKMQQLKERGWHQCDEYKSEWSHFGDLTLIPPRIIHQYLTSFAKDTEYLVIAMRYLSADRPNNPTESNPDNSVQYVYIIQYDLSAPEVRAEMGKFVEGCLKKTRTIGDRQ